MLMMAHRVMMRCLLDVLTPLSLVIKRGSSFEMGVVILIRRKVSLGDRWSVIEGCSNDSCIFSFLSILDTLFLLNIGLVAI